jgi:hypothetical protein
MSGLKHWCIPSECEICKSKEAKHTSLGKRHMQIDKDEIFLIDALRGTNQKCNCGNGACYIFIIHGNYIHLCEECLAVVGKTVIDGLL